MSERPRDRPVFIEDRYGNTIYLTWERWDHALGHPGMDDSLLALLIGTLQAGSRKQDRFDQAKYKYTKAYADLPIPYTDMVVVVKFGWQGQPPQNNNFVLTAYLVEKW